MGYPQQSHPDGKKVLERISKETGGRFFEVSKKQPIDQIYASIEEELRNQYSLGYSPDKADAEPGYHKIPLTTTQKDLIVQTRDGYYSAGRARPALASAAGLTPHGKSSIRPRRTLQVTHAMACSQQLSATKPQRVLRLAPFRSPSQRKV